MKYDFDLAWSEDNSMTLLLRQIQPGSTVLEFGTATGYMTRYLKEQLHCRVYGVEIDPEAAKQAAGYVEDMIVGDIDALAWAQRWQDVRFDYILFADVLEHLRDPWKVMREAAALLQADGVMLTSIPNISHNAVIMELLAGRFEYRKLGLLDDTHLRFFTRDSVKGLLRQAGLQPYLWLDTRAKAQDTELQAQPDVFSQTFRTLLDSRPDGEVYQFVTASRKEQAASEESEDYLQAAYLHTNLLQVYWPTPKGFAENASLSLPLDPRPEFVSYRLALPALQQGALRLDPGSKPARIELKALRLFGEDRLVQQWTAATDFDGLSIAGGAVLLSKSNDGCYAVFALHNDPQLLLENVNWELISEGEATTLEIVLKVDTAAPSRSLEPVQDYFTNALQAREAALAQQLSQLEQEKSRLEQQNQRMEQQRQGLEQLLQSMEASHSWKLTRPLRTFGSWLR